MATWSYTFKHLTVGNTPATWTTLSNVTAANLYRYRDNVVDCIAKSNGRIVGRRPDLLPTINVGDVIQITFGDLQWEYVVADFSISYGFTSSGDSWSIELEDLAALMGRATYTGSWTDAKATLTQWDIIVPAFVGDIPFGPGVNLGKLMSAQSVTNMNLLQLARIILDTTQYQQSFATWDLGGLVGFPYPVMPAASNWRYTTGTVFNDGSVTAITAAHWKYDQIRYSSVANNYWNKVICEPSGLAAQTAGTGSRVYSFQTYNRTTDDAADAAAFTLSKFDSSSSYPIHLTAQLKGQGASVPGINLDDTLTIYFRGATVYAAVIGVAYDMQPSDTRVELTLAPYAGSNYLVLDDSILGRLDYNKLSF